MDKPLDGKVALVTGSTGNLGGTIATVLGENGADVAAHYLENREAAEEVAARLEEKGARAIACQADTTDSQQVGKMISDIAASLGPIDILVNAVGSFAWKPAAKTTKAEWDDMIGTNLTAVFLISQAVLEDMRRRRWGRIVNLAVAGADRLRGTRRTAAYQAAKTGLISLSRSLALEEAGYGITVNVVSPSFIETSSMTEDVRKEALRLTPAGRLATPEEVAWAVLFFISDEAALITGNVLDVSGGFGV